ncbi:adenylosuccinate lyase [Citreicella sp. C3M06]|uniref:adenylosuccinate lyase n=1 Tax=Citreicella sp. C3M06 TaxID=2841564 RepID=UPI001C07FD18|nr:adenylosuccinate lyase [Citreicella sp. C3M06]MBU2962197.1 adenylosuccinate lyase [Citreicella sp. C3M06]
MTIKAILTAIALVWAPAFAWACAAHEDARMTCAEGAVYDSATHSCKVVSG